MYICMYYIYPYMNEYSPLTPYSFMHMHIYADSRLRMTGEERRANERLMNVSHDESADYVYAYIRCALIAYMVVYATYCLLSLT